MAALQLLAAEFALTVANGEVWFSIGLALLLGAGCLVFGTWVARTVGLLPSIAPAGETLGVGLASGLIVLAAWWAAAWSGGRSSFTPVAIGFAVAICLAVVQRVRRQPASDVIAEPGSDGDEDAATRRWSHQRPLIFGALAGGLFIVAIALLYGSTMAPSARDGVQPVEFNDTAFYAVLGRDLATTGTETNLSASGFSEFPGLPPQTWYHWAEIWLASAVIAIFGIAPLAARYLVVLPVVLVAAAALTGTLVQRVTGTGSGRPYVFGFLVCLFLAPFPLIPGPFFSSWAVGMIFGITLYGLSAAAVLAGLYAVATIGVRPPSWALATYVGSGVAFIVPAHLAVAILAMIGVGSVWAIRVAQSLRSTSRLPVVLPIWRRTVLAAGVALVSTVVWGLLTGHGLGVSTQPIVAPFNASWRDSIAIVVLGAGVFFAMAIAWTRVRGQVSIEGDLYVGTAVLLVVGAIAWGARLGEFTMFYLFFAGIAVIATPVTAIAVLRVWEQLRATRHRRLAIGLAVLCAIQLEFGAVNGIIRLQGFGALAFETIPVGLLDAIKRLPPDAKLAYACSPLGESGFGVPQLLTIDAHANRRVVPMCFEAEVLSTLIGAPPNPRTRNLFFNWAPQQVLYPDAAADPSSAAVTAFLKDHGIGYIYVDAIHPNTMVDGAVPIATSGAAVLLKIP